MVQDQGHEPLRDLCGWLGILAGVAVFVAALAAPLDDPALVLALVMGLRSSRMILDVDSRPAPAPPSPAWTAAASC